MKIIVHRCFKKWKEKGFDGIYTGTYTLSELEFHE